MSHPDPPADQPTGWPAGPPADQPAGPLAARGSAPLPPPASPPLGSPGPGFVTGTAPLPAPAPQPPEGGAGEWTPTPPLPGFGPPAPARRRGAGQTVALALVSVLAVVLLAAGGGLGYLWWTTQHELDQTRTDLQGQVDDLTGTVASRDAEIDRLSNDLQENRDRLSEAETDLAGTENMVELLEEQQDTIRRCIVLSGEVNETFANGGTPSQAQLDEVETTCSEADLILGF